LRGVSLVRGQGGAVRAEVAGRDRFFYQVIPRVQQGNAFGTKVFGFFLMIG